MNESVRVIKMLITLSIISLMLTYAVSVNSEFGLLRINSPYISNNFVFSICGGFFASVIVALVCEIRRYLDLKNNATNIIYSQFTFIYGQLRIIYNNIHFYQKTPIKNIPSKLLHLPTENINKCVNNLSNVEYTPLFRKDKISNVMKDFKLNYQQILNEYLIKCLYLDIALKTDDIDNLENNKTSHVTSTYTKTKAVLQILENSIKPIINDIDNCLQNIDNQCKYRFEWKNIKNNIDRDIQQYQYIELDNFITRNLNNSQDDQISKP